MFVGFRLFILLNIHKKNNDFEWYGIVIVVAVLPSATSAGQIFEEWIIMDSAKDAFRNIPEITCNGSMYQICILMLRKYAPVVPNRSCSEQVRHGLRSGGRSH